MLLCLPSKVSIIHMPVKDKFKHFEIKIFDKKYNCSSIASNFRPKMGHWDQLRSSESKIECLGQGTKGILMGANWNVLSTND